MEAADIPDQQSLHRILISADIDLVCHFKYLIPQLRFVSDHILQRSQDEAPSAGPPTALPPSAGVPVTLPDRWINPGRWPGHDGEVW